MSQIQSPETFADGQQVTAARLNNMVSGATLLPGSITSQTAISGSVATNDSLVIHDTSVPALRRVTTAELLGGGVPVTASTITATQSVTTPEVRSATNGDVRIIPQNGLAVSGRTFASVNGTSVTITATAHGLVAGQVISVTASVTAYSGTFSITSVTTDTIVYTLPVAATPASGTCSYTKQAASRVAGNEVVEGNLYVAGTSSVSSLSASGNLSVSGTTTIPTTGTLSVLGNMTNKSLPFFAVRAFARFNARSASVGNLTFTTNPTTTPQSETTTGIHSAGNIASIAKTAVGTYTVVMTTPMPDCNYTVVVSSGHNMTVSYNSSADFYITNTSTFQIVTANQDGLFDAMVNLVVIG